MHCIHEVAATINAIWVFRIQMIEFNVIYGVAIWILGKKHSENDICFSFAEQPRDWILLQFVFVKF